MKIRIIILLTLLTITCASCTLDTSRPDGNITTDDDLYKCFVTDIANDGVLSPSAIQMHIDTTESFVDDKKVGQKTQIGFSEKMYDCYYVESRTVRYEYEERDVYESESKKYGERAAIHFDSTGSVCYKYASGELHADELLTLPDITKESAIQLARDYASEYVDISQYSIEVSEYSVQSASIEKEQMVQFYKIKFIRIISGIQSTDQVVIHVSSKGRIFLFHRKNTNKFNDLIDSKIDTQKVEKSALKKAKSMYERKYGNCEAELQSKLLTYSPEGELIVVCRVAVKTSLFDTLVEIAAVIE